MEKPSIKSITLKNLVRFFILLIIVLTILLAVEFRNYAKKNIQNKAFAIAEVIKAGLTAHMKAGIMDKRDYFIREIASTYEIDSIHVIRPESVTKNSGLENDKELKDQKDLLSVFETSTPLFIWDDFSVKPKIRAIIPYQATIDETLNCLSCHDVPPGTVLGAIDMQIDATPYRDSTVMFILIVAITLSIFSLFIIINMFKVVDHHIKQPLCNLVEQARDTYHRQVSIDTELYESYEIEYVAKNINDFNIDILRHQKELELKNRQLQQLNQEIEATLKETLFAMGRIEEIRSSATKNHTTRVVLLSKLLAEIAGLSEDDIKLITIASPIHDIGKIGIPDNILNKPGRLTAKEFEVMKGHTDLAYTILKHSDRDILKAGTSIAYEHHEKYDGSGYPRGLKGEDIHIYARIVSVVDVFDALSAKRCYKDPWPRELVLKYFAEERGRHFDPTFVDLFLEHIEEFYAIIEKYEG